MAKKNARRKGQHKQERMRHWTSPNKTVIREYAERARGIGVIHWIADVVEPPDVIEMVSRFEDVKPHLVMPARGHQIPEERDPAPPFIRVLLKLWSGDRHQGISQFHHQKYPHPSGELLLFFSGNEYIWGQIRLPDLLRLSITYIGRGPAWKAYERDRIQWIMRKELPPSLRPPA